MCFTIFLINERLKISIAVSVKNTPSVISKTETIEMKKSEVKFSVTSVGSKTQATSGKEKSKLATANSQKLKRLKDFGFVCESKFLHNRSYLSYTKIKN